MGNEFKLVLFLIIIAVVSYLLGGVNGAIITSLNIFRKDVRSYGSGNAGLTNFARVFGTNGMVMVVLVDVLKTVVAVSIGRWLMGFDGYQVVGTIFAGFCTMLGHVCPIYYDFKGGKAMLCAGTLVWMIDWRVGLICWSVFLIAVIFTKYVSLGSMLGGAILPITAWVFEFQSLDIYLCLFCTVLILFAHRENLVRLIKGTENKLSIGGGHRNATEPPRG